MMPPLHGMSGPFYSALGSTTSRNVSNVTAPDSCASSNEEADLNGCLELWLCAQRSE